MTVAPLFLPAPAVGGPPAGDIGRFMGNVEVEVRSGLDPDQVMRLMDLKSGHGVRRVSPEYWSAAYDRPLHAAAELVRAAGPAARVLDVCAGTGTQSILFAALGGQVIAIDRDTRQLDLLRARLDLYERLTGIPLDVDAQEADATSLDGVTGPFDVIYSHAGWTALLSAPALARQARDLLKPGGVLILWLVNSSSVWRRFTNGAPDPPFGELIQAGEREGLEHFQVRGTTSVPRPVWTRFPTLARAIDRPLGRVPRTWIHVQVALRRAL